MQDKHEQPEFAESKFPQLGEHGAIPGAPNGPPDPFMMLGVPGGDSAVQPIQNPESKIQNPTFFPIRDLPKIAHEDADWVWDGYLARGAVTLLVSEPKAGNRRSSSA